MTREHLQTIPVSSETHTQPRRDAVIYTAGPPLGVPSGVGELAIPRNMPRFPKMINFAQEPQQPDERNSQGGENVFPTEAKKKDLQPDDLPPGNDPDLRRIAEILHSTEKPVLPDPDVKPDVNFKENLRRELRKVDETYRKAMKLFREKILPNSPLFHPHSEEEEPPLSEQ